MSSDDGVVSDKNFICDIIENEVKPGGRCDGLTVCTRFPPEPNGYLHIGHAKAICLNFNVAKKFNGKCNLRMDDTNPTKEDVEYVDSIKNDIKWLGFDWNDRFFYASDYFEKMYEFACELISKGLAYVCELSAEDVKKNRGDLKNPAVSPYRDRPTSESLELFRRMRNGDFPDGAMTLRAKIDLSSGNFNMRDPVIYRIAKVTHHRTGDKWCIYPMYDYAHPIEDALEGVTHSLCSLEFEDHRPLYEWVINNIDEFKIKPRQIEFARLNVTNTVMSKRKLKCLIERKIVNGWDDPRMPTISGLRRRGYTPKSIRNFCSRIGVAKTESTVDFAFLEHCLREELNQTAPRVMAVLDPINLIITNLPEDYAETVETEINPNADVPENRKISFCRNLYIEKTDFAENPPKKYHRLFVNNLVRLKSAYVIKCTGFEKDSSGNLTTVFAKYLPETKGGINPKDTKVRGAIHWVSARDAFSAEVRLYENLFTEENPEADGADFIEKVNPNSLKILKNCKLEPCLKNAKKGENFQFVRHGYFCVDSSSTADNLVFNKSVGLKESFKF